MFVFRFNLTELLFKTVLFTTWKLIKLCFSDVFSSIDEIGLSLGHQLSHFSLERVGWNSQYCYLFRIAIPSL